MSGTRARQQIHLLRSPCQARGELIAFWTVQRREWDASIFDDGQYSMPYFEAFQFYFDHIDLYEAAYPEWRSQ
jgi:hypothetical protein